MDYIPPDQHYEYSIHQKIPQEYWVRIKNVFEAYNPEILFDESDVEILGESPEQSIFLISKVQAVIKLFNEKDLKSSLLQKCLMIELAAEKGLAPPVWYCDINNYGIIMEFIAAKARPESVLEAISLLKAFHQPIENEPFSTIHKRVDEILQYDIKQNREIQTAHERLKKIESIIKPAYTLCHFDFHKDNFVSGVDRTYLIDFDKAGYGHPFYDIAKFSLLEKSLTPEAILLHYLERDPTEEERHLMDLMIQVANFSAATNRTLRWIKGGFVDEKLLEGSLEYLDRFLENTQGVESLELNF